jgi:hypothetical protein
VVDDRINVSEVTDANIAQLTQSVQSLRNSVQGMESQEVRRDTHFDFFPFRFILFCFVLFCCVDALLCKQSRPPQSMLDKPAIDHLARLVERLAKTSEQYNHVHETEFKLCLQQPLVSPQDAGEIASRVNGAYRPIREVS